MPTKYTREDFRERALGLRHTLKEERQKPPRGRMGPKQVRLIILLSALGIAVFYLGGELFSRTRLAPQPLYDTGMATVVELEPVESAQGEPDYVLHLEIHRDGAPDLTATMRTGPESGTHVKRGDRVGVEYRLVDGNVDVKKLEVVVGDDAQSPSTLPDSRAE